MNAIESPGCFPNLTVAGGLMFSVGLGAVSKLILNKTALV